MTDEEKIEATAGVAAKQKSLELLYDYTKFHIGVYLTLTSSYIALANANFNGTPLVPLNRWFLWPAILLFVVAGVAGGIIVSSITQKVGGSSTEFLEDQIGPWSGTAIHLRGKTWTYIEHTSFWLGLVVAILSFGIAQRAPAAKPKPGACAARSVQCRATCTLAQVLASNCLE